MGNYVNVYGTAIGPIQIEPSGTWLQNILKPIGQASVDTNHLTFSLNKLSKDGLNTGERLALLRAETPLIGGVYEEGEDGNLQYKTYCDPKTLVTAEWVAGFAMLKPGEQQLDLSNFVTYKAFSDLSIKVENNSAFLKTIDSSLLKLRREFDNYVEDPFPQTIILECGNSSSFNEVI